MTYSIKNYTWKFQNTFRNGFSSQYVLFQAKKWGINIGQKASFNDKFHRSKSPLNHTTRLSYTYQLNVNNFKTEKYGSKSIVNKCTLD